MTSRLDRTRGWCPGVLDPMMTGDGWLVRVRLPGGTLPPGALDVLSEVAARDGSGAIDFTSRANIQLRGIAPAVLDAVADHLAVAGLAATEAPADALRSIAANPLAGHDPSSATDAAAMVAALVGTLGEQVSEPVPSKFLLVVDDGGRWPLHTLDADARIVAGRGAGRWSVLLRRESSSAVGVDDPVAAAVATAQLCGHHHARMDEVVAILGRDEVLHRLGGAAMAHPAPSPRQPVGPGVSPHPDPRRRNLVVTPFLGRTDATDLRSIGLLLSTHALEVRVTPTRGLACCGVAHADVERVSTALASLGWIVQAADRRGQLSGCVGSRGCASSSIDTVVEAERLLDRGPVVERIHLSGCAKGCGAPRGVRHLVADAGVLRDVAGAR